MNCLFCKIAENKNERLTIFEDNMVVVIMDKFPICDGHLLVISKNHYETIMDVPNDVLTHMFDVAKKYALIDMKVLNETGCSFSINYGTKQEIKHLHLHVMPNYNVKPSKNVEEVYKLIMEGLNEEEKKI